MRYSFDLDVLITKNQVDQYGELTGDNGAIHSKFGVVQGGLILGMLPKWLSNTDEGKKFLGTGKTAVGMILNSKFRRRLQADVPVKINFSYDIIKDTTTRIFWRLYDSEKEYCSGEWVIHKAYLT